MRRPYGEEAVDGYHAIPMAFGMPGALETFAGIGSDCTRFRGNAGKMPSYVLF